MDLDLEELNDECIHPVVDHDDGTFDGIVYGKVKNSAEKVLMFAKVFYPGLKCCRPFAAIFFEVVLAVKQKLKLVVGIVVKPEDARQRNIEIVKVAIILTFVLLNLVGHVILDTQRVMAHQIFDLNKIDEVVEERLFQGKLCLFEDIVLVAWEKLTEHV